MKKWILSLGSLTAIVAAVAVALFAAGVFDDDHASGDRTSAEADGDALGICIEGAEDCVDTVDEGGAGDDLRCAEDAVDCDEPVDSGDGVAQICLAGAEDCDDTPSAPPGDDVVIGEPAECSADLPIACERRATDAAAADLQDRLGIGPDDLTITDVDPTEFPNACLGVQAPDEVCAEVITPGYVIYIDALGETYVYHADSQGNIKFVE
jgi:hypothetical protein